MALDRSAADALLKNLYLGPVRKQINQGRPLLAEIEKTSEPVEGKQIFIPLQTQRNEGIGARAESGTLPTALNAKYKELTTFVKYEYGRIELTLPVMKSMKSDRGSFLRAVDSETESLAETLKEDFDRQIASNDSLGRGTLASTGATTASTTIVIAGADKTTARKLRKGMFIDIIDVDDDAVVASNREVTAVNGDPVTSIVISGAAVTTDATHRVVRAGSWKNEIIGLPGIVSNTGTLYGVDPTVHDVWKSTSIAAGGALSEDLMQQVVDAVGIDSGVEGLRIVCEPTQRRKFYGLLQSMKRAVNTLELKGGFKTLTFNDDIPLVVDKFVDPTVMYFVDMKSLFLAEASDWEWADDDGAVLSRVANKAAYEAFMYKYCELITTRRNAHGKLTGLTT